MSQFKTGKRGSSRSKYGASLRGGLLQRSRQQAGTRVILDQQPPGAPFTNVNKTPAEYRRSCSSEGSTEGELMPINPNLRRLA